MGLQALALAPVGQHAQQPSPLPGDGAIQQGQGVLHLPIVQVIAEQEEESLRCDGKGTGRVGADRQDPLGEGAERVGIQALRWTAWGMEHPFLGLCE